MPLSASQRRARAQLAATARWARYYERRTAELEARNADAREALDADADAELEAEA